MTRDDIIKMAREAGAMFDHMTWVERDLAPVFERFAELVAAVERNKLASWMIRFGLATGHGDTMDQLCDALGTEIADSIDFAVDVEREQCARLCDDMVLYTGFDCAKAIRSRSQDENE